MEEKITLLLRCFVFFSTPKNLFCGARESYSHVYVYFYGPLKRRRARECEREEAAEKKTKIKIKMEPKSCKLSPYFIS